jgi:hypothetical protein
MRSIESAEPLAALIDRREDELDASFGAAVNLPGDDGAAGRSVTGRDGAAWKASVRRGPVKV